MPDQPELLVRAARTLYAEAEAAPQRRPLLEKAVRVPDGRAVEAQDRHARAVALAMLGRSAEALTAYRELLQAHFEQAEWRCEYARLLCEQGMLEEARRELVVVLAQRPKDPQARELLALISHELARKR